MTKRQQQMVNNYYNSNMYNLSDLYKTCSFYKTRADYMIRNEMIENNGYNYKICGGNSCTFTCGYLMQKDNTTILVYHTHCNRYEIVLD